MPGITNPAEEYFKDGLWGWAATVWEKLISSGGRLFTALHGWDGSAWRKLPLVWGYSERFGEVDVHTMLSDDSYTFYSTPVPANYVYKLEVASFYNAVGARGRAYIAVRTGGASYYLAWTATPAIDQPTIWTGALTLKEGDQILMLQDTCITNDVLRAMLWGYVMKVTE